MTRVAWITGASGGIGSAIARCFAAQGYALVLQYHTNRQAIDTLLASLPDGTKTLTVQADLSDAQKMEISICDALKRVQRVDVLVNCAGIALEQMVLPETTEHQMQQVFEVNVFGSMRVTRLLYDALRECRGTVINISSMWGITGASCEVVYSTSKAALIGFTKALAKELAPCGVTVNCIAPGFIPTEMNAKLSEEAVEDFRQETPLLRLGTPEDIAQAALYLAQARFVTGQVLSVDGGIVI